jgi:Raf kinase inhibitor-like YbhB/YbcL family protein
MNAAGMTVWSDAFSEGGTIPDQCPHTFVGGGNVSPHLAWSGAPAKTASFAITCWDPDAPTTVGFSHWVRFDSPAATRAVAPGDPARGPVIDGITDWGDRGYGGMAPPPGDSPHRYIFALYALDVPTLGVDAATTYAKFRFLARTHTLEVASVTGLYGLPGA